jgi:hypothetical protein
VAFFACIVATHVSLSANLRRTLLQWPINRTGGAMQLGRGIILEATSSPALATRALGLSGSSVSAARGCRCRVGLYIRPGGFEASRRPTRADE